jgi:hypothetical protein
MNRWEANLRQARSDYQVFILLCDPRWKELPECHALRYLQMATEKLAKAAFMAMGMQYDWYSHIAFSRIPRQLKRRDIARSLGYKRFDAYQTFLSGAAPLFREIDELHPAVGPGAAGGGPKEGPNAEYPWPFSVTHGAIDWRAPADHTFGLLKRLRTNRDAAQVLQFIRILLDRFEAVFRP